MSSTENTHAANRWALTGDFDLPGGKVFGGLPGRWGRMTPLSRLTILKVGNLLREHRIVTDGKKCVDGGQIIGLIGATRRGSLHTDQAFLESVRQGTGLASPALFGYTLPNVSLSEAAAHYGLVGPVYALFAKEQLLKKAVEEAELLLKSQFDLTHVIACSFDHYLEVGGSEIIDVNLKLIERNA